MRSSKDKPSRSLLTVASLAASHRPPALESLSSSYGSTPVDPEDRQYLLPQHADVATNAELNELEADNILDATLWADDCQWQASDLFSQSILRQIHSRMFDQVWSWAGTYRSREVNIGNCPPEEISIRLEQILGNLNYQAKFGRPAEEVCTEFHHCIVQIHPFYNGNGRHARLTTRLLAESLGLHRSLLTWGKVKYSDISDRKKAYIDALREADQGRFATLKSFIF